MHVTFARTLTCTHGLIDVLEFGPISIISFSKIDKDDEERGGDTSLQFCNHKVIDFGLQIIFQT